MGKRVLILLLIMCITACSSEKSVDNSIIISKIGINRKYEISSINKRVNEITMFSEYGNPSIKNSNVIIGAHSGSGINAYFKDLNKLEQGDIVLITYENIEYKYEVSRIYEVDESDLSILKSNGISKLTLLTCKDNDDKIRLIVEATPIDK